jgi:hypothetical protein
MLRVFFSASVSMQPDSVAPAMCKCPLTNEALRHEGVWGSGCIDPDFLDLNTSWT